MPELQTFLLQVRLTKFDKVTVEKTKQFEVLQGKTEKVAHGTLFAMITIFKSYYIKLLFFCIKLHFWSFQVVVSFLLLFL